MIWGLILEPGKLYTEVFNSQIHLSMASLESRREKGSSNSEDYSQVVMKTADSEYLLCTLAKGVIFQQNLDFVLMPQDQVSFFVEGSKTVHLTGSYYKTSADQIDEKGVEGLPEVVIPCYERDQAEMVTEEITGSYVEEFNSAENYPDEAESEEQSVSMSETPTTSSLTVKQEPADEIDRELIEEMSGEDSQMTFNDGLQNIPNLRREEDSEQSHGHLTRRKTRGGRLEHPSKAATGVWSSDTAPPFIALEVNHHRSRRSRKKYKTGLPLSSLPEETRAVVSRVVTEASQISEERQPNQNVVRQSQNSALPSRRTRRQPAWMVGQGGNTITTPSPVLSQNNTIGNQNATATTINVIVQRASRKKVLPTMFRHRCKQCGKAFQYQGALMRHQLIHNKEGQAKCPFCRKIFANWTLHKIHKCPYAKIAQCKYCGKQFTQVSNLRIHERIHTGEKPFVCGHCGKAFTQQSTLSRHERTHTGEKPFACYCGKVFTRSFTLQSHQQRFHRKVHNTGRKTTPQRV